MKIKNWLYLSIFILIIACRPENKTLPYMGPEKIVDGDTLFHQIPEFSFIDQDSNIVTEKDLTNSIYVADFFFTSCPSICPKVKKQMLRIYDKYSSNPHFKLVSHTIDPKRDTPGKLKQYAKNLDVDTDKWIFLTGDKDSLMNIAEDYLVTAYEDPDAPGGFDHSGMIILVDPSRHIRGYAEGTDPKSVTDFFKDIEALMAEYDLE